MEHLDGGFADFIAEMMASMLFAEGEKVFAEMGIEPTKEGHVGFALGFLHALDVQKKAEAKPDVAEKADTIG